MNDLEPFPSTQVSSTFTRRSWCDGRGDVGAVANGSAENNQEEAGYEGQEVPPPRRPITSASLPSKNTSAGQPGARAHAHDLRLYSSVSSAAQQPVKFAPNPVYEGVRAARLRMEESGSGLRHEVSNGSVRFSGAQQDSEPR